MVSEYVKKEIEEYRKKYLMYKRLHTVFLGVVFIVLASLGIALLPTFIRGNSVLSPFPFLLIAVFVISAPYAVLRKEYIQSIIDYKAVYKKHVVMNVLDTQLDNVVYLGDQGFSRQQIQDFQLVPSANYMGSEDYLKAVYKDIVFEQADVSVIRRARKGHDITCFRGRMLKIHYSPTPVEDVRIFTKSFKYREDNKALLFRDFFGKVHVLGGDTTNQRGTEDAEFDKQYDVYSVNEQDVWELFTPKFREAIKSLASCYDSIAFHFKGNEVYVAIASEKNTFACPADKILQYEVEEQKIIADVNEIKILIDALNGVA